MPIIALFDKKKFHLFAELSPDKPNPTAEYIGTPNTLQLAEAYNDNIQWDSADRTACFYFYRDQMREWIFFTDLRTFKERSARREKWLAGLLLMGSGAGGSGDLEFSAEAPLRHVLSCVRIF